ncbi:tripartite tricarboxylate transporter substrate binding protein [Mameliella sediminis]|uniref:tripartite tricarboxylate transporter substrate binding protein n=1 Tax=Mameliella sediminis TaxID=2836866 RepID=UPI001C4760A4|nr:tripartite tricarboxylate transporter substrate binding protein [Mameliella sediminis]MBY6115574.1 tripartite tricarboxylate transporter substrate binding protein [Antarctobacter heliothermus]MBY6145821.1 tripartite tricarboxylate transporter substrate binding protein [Mameliella alba]MBV7393458.1 tripartite tricarboxylate transporter substrate binding protein [Mameliella sediminis]MBY6161143.1 tripartite tricarboxylate transporter substrate binding protein [Mameliella alba]MBY6169613.1 tri
MTMIKRLAVSALALALSTGAALAEWPERPITIITPWPPGDVEDTIARLVADRMEAEWGVPVAAVNKPGGGGVIGATEVAGAKPDGYTIGNLVLSHVTSHVALGNTTYGKDAFDVVGIYVTYPFVLAAKADAPFDDLAGLVEHAKSNDVALGHFGYGAIPTKVTLGLQEQFGFKFATDASFEELTCITLSNGDATLITTTTPQIQACLQDGSAKAITTYTEGRIATLPDTPTLGEQIDSEPIVLWGGMFVPKGTPDEVRDKIAAIVGEVMESEEVANIRSATGAELYWQGPAEAKARIDRTYDATVELLTGLGEL